MNRKYYFQYALLILFTLVLITPSFAGVLKIQTQTTVETQENQLKIRVLLSNEGTAIAHNLQVHLKILGKTLDSKIDPQLDPGGKSTFLFEEKTEGIETGRYPLTVFVDFHDSNQYPFSALSGMTFSVGPNVNPDLAVLGKNIAMGQKGELSFDIKNMGDDEKRILGTLILPKELSTPTPRIDFQMGPRSQKDLHFEIRNFSALPGADYPVFCYFEYDLENVHHTAICQAVIRIIAKENLFRQYRWVWMGLAAVLVIGFLALVFRNRGRPRE
ncbi:MAG TPA: CARDB domain-containing protein [Desulfobacteria bacterium]|nr:CARDB domain-containing protein [Desulfobacteria bacterium]